MNTYGKEVNIFNGRGIGGLVLSIIIGNQVFSTSLFFETNSNIFDQLFRLFFVASCKPLLAIFEFFSSLILLTRYENPLKWDFSYLQNTLSKRLQISANF